MKDFDWDKFKKEKIAVHCDTAEKANDFLKQCYNKSMGWSYRGSLLDYNCWDGYKENTCYSYGICYGSLEYYKRNNYKIIEWEEDDKLNNECIQNNNNEIKSKNTISNKYILYTDNGQLFLNLNKSQVNLLNLLIENNVIDTNDVINLDKVEYKTI